MPKARTSVFSRHFSPGAVNVEPGFGPRASSYLKVYDRF
jgi:hypothetical protein